MPNSNRNNSAREQELTTVSEKLARFFGVLFILVGLFLIIFLVGGFIFSKLPYRVDPNLPIPTVNEISAYTNKDTVTVTGAVLPGENISLFINGKRQKELVETDSDASFTFEEILLEEEGEYSFEAAVVRGGLFKRRSEFSNTTSVVADWTPPSTSITLKYEPEIDTEFTSVSGTVEPDATVIIENEFGALEAQADGDGNFTIPDIQVRDGENTYTVRIKDPAGNEVLASQTVVIAYVGGDLNGPGVTIGPDGKPLPESSGELQAALEFLRGNSMMFMMSIIALLAFGGSSMLAYRKAKSEKNA